MTCGTKLKEHILEHEILGLDTVSGIADITIHDEGTLIATGVSDLDFRGDIISATNEGGGNVRVSISDLQVEGGKLWVYDSSRSKWLSSDRATFGAAERGRAKNKYLPVYDGQVTNLSGYRLIRDATLIAISAQTRTTETWTLKVRKNGDLADIASLVMTGVSGNHDVAIDVDLDEGDQIQFFAETSSFFGIRDPLVWVEVAWRNDVLAMP